MQQSWRFYAHAIQEGTVGRAQIFNINTIRPGDETGVPAGYFRVRYWDVIVELAAKNDFWFIQNIGRTGNRS